MLRIIATESRTLAEFARRAEAWSSTESTPPTDQEIAAQFADADPAIVRRELRAARKTRLANRARHFETLINHIDQE